MARTDVLSRRARRRLRGAVGRVPTAIVVASGIAVVCLPTALVLLLSGETSTTQSMTSTQGCSPGSGRSNCPPPAQTTPSPALPFSPTSIWNAPLSADTPIDPNSSRIVASLVSQTRGYPVGIATSVGGVPIYKVTREERRVRVVLDSSTSPLLQSAFDRVPLPADATPAAGPDHTAVVWQPSTDTLWEFWRLRRATDGFHAGFGGRMIHVSRSPGYYQNIKYGGGFVERSYWGAPATKVSLLGGLITIGDLRSGAIGHALAVALPQVRSGVWSYPAQASDGTSDAPNAIPEGARFRLPADLDINALHLPRLTRMMAQAAQRYGIIVVNSSTGVAFRAQDPTPIGNDPYYGPGDAHDGAGYLFGGYPRELLRLFPWGRLQLIRMRLES